MPSLQRHNSAEMEFWRIGIHVSISMILAGCLSVLSSFTEGGLFWVNCKSLYVLVEGVCVCVCVCERVCIIHVYMFIYL